MAVELPGDIKRVLIVLPSIGALGGAERQGLLLARLLKEAGAEVHIWGKETPGEVAAQCNALNIPTRQIELNLRVRPLRLWLNLRRFRKLLRAARFDWIIPYTTGPNIFCAMGWRGSARACVWNQRDEGQRLGIANVDFKAASRVPVLVSNSTHAAQMLVERLRVPAKATRVVHNGVVLAPAQQSRAQWRERLGIAPGASACVMLANITTRKDHATLIAAWAEVARQLPDARLVLAGEHGDAFDACEAQARQLGLERCVLFPGPVSDVAGLVMACDLGVFSSRKEGLPNGVLECMAAGLAVAGTNIPGIAEALGDESQTLAPEGDAAGLAHCILRLLREPELRAAHAARNRARIEREFSPENMARGMIQALTEAERAAP